MTTTPISPTDTIVLDYLAALWAHSEDLTPGLRDELMSTVADYVATRRTAGEDPAEIVRWLGSPESLVAALRKGQPPSLVRLPTPPPQPVRKDAGAVEYTAIGLLTAGAFLLPVAGPLAGTLLVTGSPRWTVEQKAVAWLLTAGSCAGAFALTLILMSISFVHAPAAALIYLALCAGPFIAGLHLGAVLQTKRQPS